jgi:Protein of unknown function (DUF2393)
LPGEALLTPEVDTFLIRELLERYKIPAMSDQERKPFETKSHDEPAENSGDASNASDRVQASPEIFAAPVSRQSGMPLSAWLIAGAVVLAVLAGLLLAGHRKAPAVTGIQPLDGYASNLPLTQLQMSESTSLSGGKSTFIDGHIRNAGSSTVTGVMVQVLFHNEEQMPPQIESLPLALIRTREPYVDTIPVNVAPLKPGEDREFRLIFESIPSNWNMQMPEIRVIRVEKK